MPKNSPRNTKDSEKALNSKCLAQIYKKQDIQHELYTYYMILKPETDVKVI